jgi:hypothetical protein
MNAVIKAATKKRTQKIRAEFATASIKGIMCSLTKNVRMNTPKKRMEYKFPDLQ